MTLPDEVKSGLPALEADLDSGRWTSATGTCASCPKLDVGLRLVVADLGPSCSADRRVS
jgi:hypothetical protein